MKRIAFLLLSGLAFAGCVHRHSVVVHDAEPVVVRHDERSCDYWDGERWVIVRGHVHGPRCGHYYHHNAWHLYPHGWVYARPGCHHWGVVVRVRR